MSLAIVTKAMYFDEYASACVEWLNAYGWTASRHESFIGTEHHDGVIVVGISFFPHPPFRPGQFWVGVQSEQMPLGGDDDWSLWRNLTRYRGLRRFYDLIVEWSPANYLRHVPGSNVRFLPYGCQGRPRNDVAEEHDVLFIGNPCGSNNRRGRILETLKAEFGVCPRHHVWGQDKYNLIRASRICLNLHQFESHSFESPRFFDLLSSGAFVLSEPVAHSYPFKSGRDFITFSDDHQMMELIHYYLAHADKRREIAKAGANVASQYSFAHVFGQLSVELGRVALKRAHFATKFLSWCAGRLANARIEAVDKAAKLKGLALQKLSR
jgi:hypothetical protein